MSDQFYSFERALRELKLKSEELKRLVSEDQIRAIRDKGSMKFRKEDVERLASARGGDEELELSGESQGDAGMQTTQLSDEDTLLTEEVEEIEQEAVAAKPAKTKATVTRGGARPARAAAAAPVFEGEKKESKLVLAVAVVSSLLLFYGLLVAQSIATDSVTSLTAWLAKTK